MSEVVAPPAEDTAPPRPTGRGKWWIMIVALLIVLAVVYWLTRTTPEEHTQVVPAPTLVRQTFQERLTNARDTFLLMQESTGDTLRLPDTVWITQDTLVLMGRKNLVVQPSNKRSILQVAPSVRYLVLMGGEARDLDIRISQRNAAALRFGDVLLRNISVGVSNPLLIRDTLLQGVWHPAVKTSKK